MRLNEMDLGDPRTIARQVVCLFEQAFPASSSDYILPRFESVTDMFEGNYPGFQPMDTAYHDLEHTLQTTLCLVFLITNRHHSGTLPAISADDFNRALIAILLHDMGYLKEIGDDDGSGAKYTHIHEQRSCRHARAYLEQLKWPPEDIRFVENLIRCTGPRANIEQIPFSSPIEKVLGQSVCTADFIGQISDPRYLEKLPFLYREFIESYTYQGIPKEKWPYDNYEDLLRKTPGFYEKFVVPRMENECGNQWRFLEDPRTGENPYQENVKANLARIQAAVEALA